MLDDIKCNSWPVLAWRSGKSADLSCDRSRVRSRHRTSRFWSRVRVAFYKRMTGSLARTYTALAATHGTPRSEVASRCNPRHKGACKPNSSKDSVSGAQIPASAMVCVGAARNPWTCQDVGIELSRITPIRVVRQGVTDAIPYQLRQYLNRESMPCLRPCTPPAGAW